MDGPATPLVLQFFTGIPDPRAPNRSHLLSDIVTLAMFAVLCGMQGWEEIEEWAEENEEFLSQWLALPHGIPSHDTIEDVFRRIDPDAFERCFNAWTAALVQATQERGERERFIAIDGKTLKQSFEHGWKRSPIHMVSAFAAENQLVLGQLKVASKENEIVAIPKLLEMFNLHKTTVTIDAMGTQKEIAAKIREKKGHYVLALKDNQKLLHEAVAKTFDEGRLEKFKDWKHDHHESTDAGHGRIETRRVWVTTEIKHIDKVKEWKDLNAIVMVESTRDCDNGTKTKEVRYYITSHGASGKKLDAKLMADAVRLHWGIENKQHHVLDTTMNEDASRIRKGNSAENFARLRRIALNKLRKWTVLGKDGQPKKKSLRRKMKKCSWNPKSLMAALLA